MKNEGRGIRKALQKRKPLQAPTSYENEPYCTEQKYRSAIDI